MDSVAEDKGNYLCLGQPARKKKAPDATKLTPEQFTTPKATSLPNVEP
jgi:hypothetical protein